ncbi:MAG: glycosyltransferase [Phycisphaerales bacterium]|nr:glycosyltransferase [Phycisphaerales bacterium]
MSTVATPDTAKGRALQASPPITAETEQAAITTLTPRVADAVELLRRGRDAESWRERIRDVYRRRADASARRRAPYYYRRLVSRLQHVIPAGARVLDIGCMHGDMLAALKPAHGVGVDFVEEHVAEARKRHPKLHFECWRAENACRIDGTFDYIVISQTLSEIYDVVALLRSLLACCHDRTRLVIVNYSRLWQPALKLAEWLRIKPKAPPQNWVPDDEIQNLLNLAGWETVRRCATTLCPLPVPLLAGAINRYVANLPLMQSLCLNHVLIARPVALAQQNRAGIESVSIVVPARNEAGHLGPLLARLPHLAPRQEVVFVEGNSTDNTWDVIQELVASYRGPWTLRAMRQDGKGKGDAVRKAFAHCTGDVLMILDADISVPPEELTAFRDALAGGHAEFVNGSRMVYPMDKRAMRFLNLLGNKFFGAVFTYLLAQRFRDTLCGTKVLRRSDYQQLANNRAHFGDFDPFGDFDLLFGAARLNLKIVDLPVHYKARTYGETNISRFRHGIMLLQMCAFAARKLRFV